MDAALNNRLTSDAGITAQVPGADIVNGVRGDNLPSIMFEFISANQPTDLNNAPAGPTQSTYNINVYAATEQQAADIATLVAARLTGWRGTEGSTNVRHARYDGQNRQLEQDPRIVIRTLTYTFYHN